MWFHCSAMALNFEGVMRFEHCFTHYDALELPLVIAMTLGRGIPSFKGQKCVTHELSMVGNRPCGAFSSILEPM